MNSLDTSTSGQSSANIQPQPPKIKTKRKWGAYVSVVCILLVAAWVVTSLAPKNRPEPQGHTDSKAPPQTQSQFNLQSQNQNQVLSKTSNDKHQIAPHLKEALDRKARLLLNMATKDDLRKEEAETAIKARKMQEEADRRAELLDYLKTHGELPEPNPFGDKRGFLDRNTMVAKEPEYARLAIYAFQNDDTTALKNILQTGMVKSLRKSTIFLVLPQPTSQGMVKIMCDGELAYISLLDLVESFHTADGSQF